MAWIYSTQLDRIEAKLDQLLGQEKTHMAKLDDEITALTSEVTNNTSVENSAIKVIQGISAQIAAAVAAATAAGATTAQLASLTSLQTTLAANDTALAAAVAANTTPPPPGP